MCFIRFYDITEIDRWTRPRTYKYRERQKSKRWPGFPSHGVKIPKFTVIIYFLWCISAGISACLKIFCNTRGSPNYVATFSSRVNRNKVCVLHLCLCVFLKICVRLQAERTEYRGNIAQVTIGLPPHFRLYYVSQHTVTAGGASIGGRIM